MARSTSIDGVEPVTLPTPGGALASPGAVATADPLPARRRAKSKDGARLGWQFWLPTAWIVLLILAAILAPVLPLKDPRKSDFSALMATPGAGHWLGTDDLGRDILSRLIWGARASLMVGVFSVVIGLVIGGALGLIAGYYRGRVERVITTIADAALAFPTLVLLLSLTTFLGASLKNIIIAIGVVTTPVFLRLARANTLTYAQREFVMAARSAGAKNRRIIVREVLPNVMPSLMAFSLVVVAVAIVAEGSLSFLGMSVDPSTPTWGNLIVAGRSHLQDAPHITFIPSLVMFLTVLTLNLAGDRVRETIEARPGGL